jgi:hypothetical protein
LTLRSAGPLPFFVFDNGGEAMKAIPELLLDGVLEVEDNGRFLAGPEAADLLRRNRAPVPSAKQGRLARLSEAALRYGESLGLGDPRQLAVRLYGFGRLPVTPKMARLLANREAILSFLDAKPGTELRRRLDSDWQQADDPKMPAWLVWFNRTRGKSDKGNVHFKLYVSPALDGLPQAFAAVVEVASTRGGHFKIGSDAAGLLRPDKMVLYFQNQEALFEVAEELSTRLRGIASHGVPFSAEITPDGLLSWGMDPPRDERVLSWQEPESWRLWIVRRLAAAMIAAQSASKPEGMGPGQFALERLRHEGVDVETWTPSVSIWQARK